MAYMVFHKGKAVDYMDWKGSGIGIWWLGQAGFILRWRKLTFLLDPYLSDHLSIKYSGKKYPHIRMMPPPILPEKLIGIDFFISTHAHSDHLDPGLIPYISNNNPNCKFIIPAHIEEIAKDRGITKENMIFMDDGWQYELNSEARIYGILAAHEDIRIDEKGYSHFLGYILELGNLLIYHSGDCIPYPGLEQRLLMYRPTVALLPVNGRSPDLSVDGIAGNFTLDEALNLTESINFDFMIPHHYGMFSFNTISMNLIKKRIKERNLENRVFPAEVDIIYQLDE